MAQGREKTLTEAAETHGSRLLGFIENRLRDRQEAEDVLQEVYAELLNAYDLGQAIETLGAWLLTVARNKILDRFRRKRTRDEHRAEVIASVGADSSSSAEAAPGPDEEWTRAWLRAEIVSALELLPAEQREVFVKHELEGLSFEQIAAQTGVKVNTLISRKHYAVTFLRDHLREVYDELE